MSSKQSRYVTQHFESINVYKRLKNNSARITDVGDPISSSDAATKNYVDNNIINAGVNAGTGIELLGNTISVQNSLPNVTGVGNINTGTWSGNTINVPYGGTGKSTFASNKLLIGNGNNPIVSVDSLTLESNVFTIDNQLSIKSTDNSLGLMSGGSMTILGGMAVSKDVYFGGNTVMSQNLMVTGDVTVGSITIVGAASFTTINSSNALYTNVTSSNATMTNVTIGGVIATSISSSNLRAGTSTITNLLNSSLTTNNLTSSNIYVSGLANILGVQITNGNFGNVTTNSIIATNVSSSNVKTTNSTVVNIVSNNVTCGTLFSTNINNSQNITTNNMLLNNITVSNIVSTNVSSTNIRLTSCTVQNLISSFISTETVTASNMLLTNLTSTSMLTSNLISTNITSTNIVGTSVTSIQLSSTNITSSNIIARNVTSDNINIVVGTLGTIISSGITTGQLQCNSISATTIQMTNSTVSNLVASNITSNNATFGNINATSATFANTNVNNATFGNITCNQTNAADILGGNVSSSSLRVSGTSFMNTANISSISSGTISVSNLMSARNMTSTSMTSANIQTVSMQAVNMQAVNQQSTSITANNLSITNTVACSTLTTGTLHVGSLINIQNASILNVSSGSIIAGNISSDTVYAASDTYLNRKLTIGSDLSGLPNDSIGTLLTVVSTIFTDSSPASSTNELVVTNKFSPQTITATNTNVTTNKASTIYIDSKPAEGINQTIKYGAAVAVGYVANNTGGYMSGQIMLERSDSNWYGSIYTENATNRVVIANASLTGGGGIGVYTYTDTPIVFSHIPSSTNVTPVQYANFSRSTSSLSSTVNSANTSTGALVISGGVAIGKTLYVNSIAKGSGTFDIPHPIHPGKRLVHSFIEGPRCDLIYRGIVKLVSGVAIVNLDEDCVQDAGCKMSQGTFDALSTNPQFFLQNQTSFSSLIATLSGHILSIRCKDNTDDTVAWMVVAERKDNTIKLWDKTDQNGYLKTEYQT